MYQLLKKNVCHSVATCILSHNSETGNFTDWFINGK